MLFHEACDLLVQSICPFYKFYPIFSLKRRTSSGSLNKGDSEDGDVTLTKSDVSLALSMEVLYIAMRGTQKVSGAEQSLHQIV